MWTADGGACVSFNGEIYNYVELRAELERSGHRFDTTSDTEVLLAAWREWGSGAFERFNGQWALSLYEESSGRVLLARDRLGKAPLYYAVIDGLLCWASEIKALLRIGGSSAFRVDPRAVHEFVLEGWRDRGGTFWEGIHDFPPGAWAWLDRGSELRCQSFWRLPQARLKESEISTSDAATGLRELLVDAIRVRVRADVPIAFELSGGMDSSTLVALAANFIPGSHTAYCIDFQEAEANETPYAQAVAARYGQSVRLTLIRPESDDFWHEVDAFVALEEEPFHAPNLFTNNRLRRRMKALGAKVVVSGSAGDEVLAGYAGDYLGPFALQLLRQGRFGTLLHELRSNTEFGWGPRRLAGLFAHTVSPGMSRRAWRRRTGEAAMLDAVYRAPDGASLGPYPPAELSARLASHMRETKMNYWLRSANKVNFGIPIEPRAPFLDYRVVDFAFRLPTTYLIRDGWHKWLLRRAMEDLLPESVVWRRTKMGFPFPLRSWLLESKAVVLQLSRDAQCPYVDTEALEPVYESFVNTAPATVWRLVSLALWWKRVVRGEPLLLQAGPAPC